MYVYIKRNKIFIRTLTSFSKKEIKEKVIMYFFFRQSMSSPRPSDQESMSLSRSFKQCSNNSNQNTEILPTSTRRLRSSQKGKRN